MGAVDKPMRVIAYAVCLFIALPIVVVVVSSITGANYVTFPPEGFTLRWYVDVLADSRLMRSLRTSATVALITAALAAVCGLAASLALDRHRLRGKEIVSTFLVAPLILPSIVLALGMIFFMTAIGLIRTIPGLVLSHLVVAMPYAVRALSASLAGLNRDVERSASILGAAPLVVLYKITLPLIKPGLIAALMFSFLASFNNVALSLFVAGPRTQTLPLEIFRMTQDVNTPNVAAIASLLMAFTMVVVLVLEGRFGLYGILERQRST
jgi:putative spermidine/putrescine transport system permease protein